MPLQSGTTLGPDEIETVLGARGDSTLREVVPPMTLDGKAAQGSRILKIADAALLLLALILLIAGFPFFLFGLFLAVSQGPDGIGGDVAFGFSFGGLVSVLCALVIRAYLRRRDGWF